MCGKVSERVSFFAADRVLPFSIVMIRKILSPAPHDLA